MRATFTSLVAVGLLFMVSVVASPIPNPDALAERDGNAKGAPQGSAGVGPVQQTKSCKETMCIMVQQPICATTSDGKRMQFSNKCEMKKYACENSKALSETYTDGRCANE